MIKKILVFFIFVCSVSIYGQETRAKNLSDSSSQENTIYQVVAFPNPFSVSSQIIFRSSIEQPVLFEVKNVLGKIVYTSEILAVSGINKINFEKNDLVSGMYIYSIQTNNRTTSKRLVIK